MTTPNIIWINGPNHPDLFDGETPIRIPIKNVDVKVYRVDLSYQVISDEYDSCYVIAKNEDEAEDIAWKEIECELIESSISAKVREVDLDDKLLRSGKLKTARDMIIEYLEEKACT